MTDPIMSTVEEWTGERPLSCPWQALSAPLVGRTFHAYRFFETGNLAVALPDPSHRLVEAVSHFHSVMNRITAEQFEQDRKEAEQNRKQGG